MSLETDLPLPTSTKDVKAHKSHEVHGPLTAWQVFVLIVAVFFDYQTIEDVCILWVGTVVGIN